MTMELVQRDTLEGLAIPFGGPERRDLQDQWFSKRTDLHLEWFPADGRPVLYQHGQDEKMSGGLIGRQTSHQIDEDGVWVEVQLEKRSKYLELLRRLLDKGALGFSSGALPSLVKAVKATGEILSWPWIELSTTPVPASPDARIVAMKYLADEAALSGEAAAAAAYADYRRLEAAIGRTAPPDEDRIKTIASAAAERFAATGNMDDALDSILRAVRNRPARTDPDTGLPVVDGRS